jgi:hypothetical protein
MFKIIKSSEKTDSQPSKNTRNDSHACKGCVDGKFSGKSATAGPNPPIRRSPK